MPQSETNQQFDGKNDPATRTRAADGDRLGPCAVARVLGVERNAIAVARRAGALVFDADGKLTAEDARRQWSANRGKEPAHLRASRSGSVDDGDTEAADGGESRNAADTRAARAKADLAEIKARQAAGDLVPREQVELDAYEAGRVTQERVLTVPAKVLALVRAAPTDIEAFRLLDDALRAALRAASAEIANGATAGESAQAPDDTAEDDDG